MTELPKSRRTPKLKDERSIVIQGNALKALLKATNLRQIELARLLNVNPATLSRWGSPSDDVPTSTTFLVLIPLLLSAGVDLMPQYYPEAVTREFASVFGPQEVKRNSEKLKRVARERFLRANPDVQRARKLFEALQEAWRIIDAGQKVK
jgi:transcriptional regulator with XRE-family HTH domain